MTSQARQRPTRVSSFSPGSSFNPGGGAYRYRRQPPSGEQRDKVRIALITNRQLLARSIESIRILTIERDEGIAQLLEDGLPVPAIAAVTDLPAPKVRSIGLLYDTRPSLGASHELLVLLRAVTAKLQSANTERVSLEDQQDTIIGAAHRLGLLDRQEIAFLSGCPVAHVHRIIRGK